MSLIEDAVPPARRRLHVLLRLWWPIVAVLFAGLVFAWFGAARASVHGIREYRAYTASPTCRIVAFNDAGGCTFTDRSVGTLPLSEVVVQVTQTGRSQSTTMEVDYVDGTGLSSGTAHFGIGDAQPPLSASEHPDGSIVIEFWYGGPQWIQLPGSAERYPVEGSVAFDTRYVAAPVLICSGLYLLLMCALWWRMAYRGGVSDHEFGRPLMFFAVLVGLGVGWFRSEHWHPDGPTVLGIALALATLLGAPWPRPDRIRRAWRARRHGRGGKRGHDAVFR